MGQTFVDAVNLLTEPQVGDDFRASVIDRAPSLSADGMTGHNSNGGRKTKP